MALGSHPAVTCQLYDLRHKSLNVYDLHAPLGPLFGTIEEVDAHRPEDPAVNRAAVVPAAGEPTGQADGKDGQMGNTEKAESFLPYEKS